jgi:hypothetical protein
MVEKDKLSTLKLKERCLVLYIYQAEMVAPAVSIGNTVD